MDHSTQFHHQSADFQTFFRGWLTHLECYLGQLLHLVQYPGQQDESNLKQLTHRVMAHYHEYFQAKAQACHQNVFLVLSPPWLSSYERTFLWLAGFKPGLAIRVVKNCGVGLSLDQDVSIERLTSETKNEEKNITEMLARLEMQVVAPPLLALASTSVREVNGVVDTEVERLAEAMEYLVGCADNLREKTVAKVVGILTTSQTLRFLAAMAQLHLRIRRWGQLREDGSEPCYEFCQKLKI